MKAYLTTTAVIFALLAVAHVLRTIEEWPSLATHPGHVLEIPGIGLLAAALSFWAVRLLRASTRT